MLEQVGKVARLTLEAKFTLAQKRYLFGVSQKNQFTAHTLLCYG